LEFAPAPPPPSVSKKCANQIFCVWRTVWGLLKWFGDKIKVRQPIGRTIFMQTVLRRIRGQANFLLRDLNFKQFFK
jgi:hypothetical protein